MAERHGHHGHHGMIGNIVPILDGKTGKITRLQISSHPEIRAKLRRVFGFGPGRPGKHDFEVALSPEVAADVLWVLKRFAMDIPSEVLATLRAIDARAAQIRSFAANLEQCGPDMPLPQPDLITVPLRPYQTQAVTLATATGGLLIADELGLGKSCQGIGVLAEAGGGVVVCDTHLQQQWRDQVRKFWPTATTHIVRTTRSYLVNADVTIVPYSKLHGWQDALRPKAIVLDECQALRHAQTRRYEAAAVLRAKAKTCAGLSATPIYNYANEIWNVMNVIQPASLGSEGEFRREWCGDSLNGSVSDPIALGQYLRSQSLMIRRTRKDVGRELPKVQQITCPVEFDPSEFDKLKKEANMLAHTILHGQFTERGIASRRLTSALRQATGIAKARQVAELIGNLATNEKILVAAWHREVYGILEKVLRERGHEVCYYTGTETTAAKLQSVASFRATARIMLLSLRSGAGLDGLQEFVSTVVFAELDYSPAVMRQVIGRLNRDGQEKPVTAFLPLIDQGSDPVIASILGLKDEQSLGLIGDTEADKTLGDTDTETESRATLLARAWLAQKHHAH